MTTATQSRWHQSPTRIGRMPYPRRWSVVFPDRVLPNRGVRLFDSENEVESPPSKNADTCVVGLIYTVVNFNISARDQFNFSEPG